MEEPDFGKIEITVVGLGLIGGSLAMALKKLNPRKIWGIDIDKTVLEQAENLKFIDGGFLNGRTPLPRSDLVIICLPPGLAGSFVRENMAWFQEKAVLTDVCGLKEKITAEIKPYLRPGLDFVGGHPLAGREGSGFSQATPEMFVNANYILTPVAARRESISLLEKMIRGIGCKKPVYMEPEEHDRIMALTSHLPHIAAAALMNSSPPTDMDNVAGGSFRDATRVAEMNVELWTELLMENRENVLTQIDVFADNINKIKKALRDKDEINLKKILEKASESRKRF